MKSRILTILVIPLALISALSCKGPDNTAGEETGMDEGFILLSQEQFKGSGMKKGKAQSHLFLSRTKCNGKIEAPPGSIAWISSRISGLVESVDCKPGQYVHKGQVLGAVSSSEFIMLQQDYAESAARLKGLKMDYERKKSLFAEQIGSEREFLAAEAEYKSVLARNHALKISLELLQLNTDEIEKGEFCSSLLLKAPIDGHIVSMDIVKGQFLDQQRKLFEIVNTSALCLRLSVFESESALLKPGQRVEFRTLGQGGHWYEARLSGIGKSVDEENKTILCLADILKDQGTEFIYRSFVEANIITGELEQKALPEDAVLKSGNEYFIFSIEKEDDTYLYLKRIKVETGMLEGGMIAISGLEGDPELVTGGVYNMPVE